MADFGNSAARAVGGFAGATWNEVVRLERNSRSAVANVRNDVAKELDEAGEAFENEGFGAGMGEMLDVVAPGTTGAAVAESFGLINKEDKELVSGIINIAAVAVAPGGVVVAGGLAAAAFKDFGDYGKANAAKAAKSNGAGAPAAFVPGKPIMPIKGGLEKTPRGLQGVDLPSGVRTGPDTGAEVRDITRVGRDLDGAGTARPAGGLGSGSKYDDILNNPNLTFEEMLFYFMQAVAEDFQQEIVDKMSILSGGKGTTKPSDEVVSTQASSHASTSDNPMVALGEGLKNMDKAEAAKTLLGIGGTLTTIGVGVGATTSWSGVGAVVGGCIAGAGVACMAGGVAVGAGATDMLADAFIQMGGNPPATVASGAMPMTAREGEVRQHKAFQAVAKPQLSERDQKLVDQLENGTDEEKAMAKETLFQQLDFLTKKHTQMMQAISNVMKNMHDCSMNSIRNIK